MHRVEAASRVSRRLRGGVRSTRPNLAVRVYDPARGQHFYGDKLASSCNAYRSIRVQYTCGPQSVAAAGRSRLFFPPSETAKTSVDFKGETVFLFPSAISRPDALHRFRCCVKRPRKDRTKGGRGGKNTVVQKRDLLLLLVIVFLFYCYYFGP